MKTENYKLSKVQSRIANSAQRGTYTYDNVRVHAVTSVGNTGGIISSVPQSIQYTVFNKIKHIQELPYTLDITYNISDERITQVINNNGSLYQSKVYVGGMYEKITDATGIREVCYLSGPNGWFATYTTYADGHSETNYILKDHLGSVNYVLNEDGTVKQELSFDVWGNRRNPSTWLPFTGTPPEAVTDRGFTGHEHLYVLGLINMNGRVYDPVLGRFLSPDNYVQSPDNTQNLNRYSYCLNNPLMYTDPSGKSFWTILTGVYDFFRTGCTKGGFEVWNWGSKNFNNAWESYDPTAKWSMTNKSWKIYMGNFQTDSKKDFWGQCWELISRHTWQAPQSIIGSNASQIHNFLGGVKDVDYYGGATVIESYSEEWGAITLGSFINGNNGIKADPNTHLFQHEYGHYLQSQTSGWFYLSKYGIPSALSKDPHNQHPAEQDANVRAFKYFNKHIDGYSGWVHTGRNNNAINGYDPSLPYNDPANQAALRDGRLKLEWFDYLLGPRIIIPGLINTLVLNSRY